MSPVAADALKEQVARQLARAAESAAAGRRYGILDLEAPPSLWGVLSRRTGTAILPWPATATATGSTPVLVETGSGMLRWWPRAVAPPSTRINIGQTGTDPDGPTREW